MALTYAQSGVNIAAGESFVQRIRKSARSTYSKAVLSDIGAFGGFYDARFKSYKAPVLVSSVDGVGTKVLIAQRMNIHHTMGQDLVNHCVNDILVCGARPLFFLDYFATGKLDLNIANDVISGFVKACRENTCSLIGGETAEMPGLYKDGEYDLAGTIVGVVEKKDIIDGTCVEEGDILVGLPSSGLHTNGYSLARTVLLKEYDLNDYVDELGDTVGNVLLAIHRSYLEIATAVLKRFDVSALAHITGGGIIANTMRVVPKEMELAIDWNAWKRPMIFQLIQRLGTVPEDDMRRTFNLGVGMVLIVPRKQAADVVRFLLKRGEMGFVMGEVH